jgi:hypothetical protein
LSGLAFDGLFGPAKPFIESGNFWRVLGANLGNSRVTLLTRCLAQANAKVAFAFVDTRNLVIRY